MAKCALDTLSAAHKNDRICVCCKIRGIRSDFSWKYSIDYRHDFRKFWYKLSFAQIGIQFSVCVCVCVWNPRKHTLYQYIVLKGEGEREGKNKSKDRIVEWRRWLAWRSSFNSLTRYTQLKTVLCIQLCVDAYSLLWYHLFIHSFHNIFLQQ